MSERMSDRHPTYGCHICMERPIESRFVIAIHAAPGNAVDIEYFCVCVKARLKARYHFNPIRLGNLVGFHHRTFPILNFNPQNPHLDPTVLEEWAIAVELVRNVDDLVAHWGQQR